MSLRGDRLLIKHFRETRGQFQGLLLKIWGGGFLVVMTGFALAWFFIQPAPPKTIVMVTGSEDAAYHEFAESYAANLRSNGVTLELRKTNGSIENYQVLQNDPEVDLAIVQGGTAPPTATEAGNLESLASLYFEPVWLFYRSEEPFSDLRDLRGKRIAIGQLGSGTASMAMLLLGDNGISNSADTTLVSIGGSDAKTQLEQGQVDAAFFVTSPSTDMIGELIADDAIRLMNFERHAAYARRHPFLTSVILAQGVIDLEHDLPRSDILMIAPAANLVATSALHDALIPLLLGAATETHSSDGSLLQRGRLPSAEFVEFPLNESARMYFDDGPPFLQKYLPFWVASAVDRGKILLLPALTLLLPLFRIAPPLYRWRIRSRIYRWYEILRGIEIDLRSQADVEMLHKHEKTLLTMEGELDDLSNVPLSYMQEFYNLRLHVEFVERRLTRDLATLNAATASPERTEPIDSTEAIEQETGD
ncbi:MAG: TAXI family TRAP transporter solute-binding subunit [Rubripirellula sp.]|nr:TAXI family TRAP transporter solute-binding subunit [Rubripirellula sp.]